MKKAISFLLGAAFFLGVAAGCVQQTQSEAVESAPAAPIPFTAENEIVTYRRGDPSKTQLLVSKTGNVDIEPLCAAFEAQNADVQIVTLDITGGNDAYKPLADWIIRGYAPDIVISAAAFFDETLTASYFENLSTRPAIQNYEVEALKRIAEEDDIYCLPGPSDVNAMLYNKTLFAKYGWEVPATFDEFVRLCDQIRADTNGAVEPWNPNAKYSQELQTAMEAMTYEALFGGVENRSWYNDFIAGNAVFAGHMEPYMDALETLADHGILREEHFSYSATTRGKEFAEGRIAMINMSLYDADNAEFDFGFMPYPTTKGELGYLCDTYNCHVGVPVKAHTAAQADAIDRFLAFFSSPEGQRVYIGDSLKLSNVRGVALNASADLAALRPAIEAGHMIAAPSFASETGKEKNFDLHQIALAITTGAQSGAECIAAVDAEPYCEAAEAAAAADAASETLAVVPADMTILETSLYLAEAYREAADADIGLIAHNLPYRGNVMRLFAGALTPEILTVLKPRSFDNDSALLKATMTGRQLMNALDHPAGQEGTADCIYACAGLQYTAAPWRPAGERYVSLKLADGSPLAMDASYTVAFWEGTVAAEYLGGTPERFEGAWEALIGEKLKADGTAAPLADGGLTLVWD